MVTTIIIGGFFSESVMAAGPPGVSAQTAIVIEQTTGRVLYEKNADVKKYPASTTKMLTALLAIEASKDLNQKIKIPAEAAGVEGSSIYLKLGEEISMKDLLYGLMLRSGNDAAVAIANHIGKGKTENFVQMMNQRAAELGCNNTNFSNPNGLQNKEHYTTARDLAKIARAAMNNEIFSIVVGSKSWVSDRAVGDFTHFFNKNKVIFQYEGGTGIKTGYTTTAGRCLAASSERNGMKVICIVMDAPDWFNDSYALMNYAFDTYEVEKLITRDQVINTVRVAGGEAEYAKVVSVMDILMPKRKGEENKATIMYEMGKKATAPINRYEACGKLKIYWEGEFLSEVPLYFAEDIDKKKSGFKRWISDLL